ncbi:hypothetical protein NRB20_17670 [Nocardia sp. RB20]|uniref:Uncharacterized protein n=1 Tax=Nocardia macrotermitis TaxID=2585198 RepID=A0A7K0CZ06_9NOCA|nr:hypothetical protein [Nocardia macrotermitis]
MRLNRSRDQVTPDGTDVKHRLQTAVTTRCHLCRIRRRDVTAASRSVGGQIRQERIDASLCPVRDARTGGGVDAVHFDGGERGLGHLAG